MALARRGSKKRQAGEAAALDPELDQAEPLEHLEGEASVGAVVQDEALPVLLEETQDLLGAVVAGEGLAFAQDHEGHRVEAVVVHPNEGAAQEEDPVVYDAAGIDACREPRATTWARRRRAPGPSRDGPLLTGHHG
jgi:hypothetical protein